MPPEVHRRQDGGGSPEGRGRAERRGRLHAEGTQQPTGDEHRSRHRRHPADGRGARVALDWAGEPEPQRGAGLLHGQPGPDAGHHARGDHGHRDEPCRPRPDARLRHPRRPDGLQDEDGDHRQGVAHQGRPEGQDDRQGHADPAGNQQPDDPARQRRPPHGVAARQPLSTTQLWPNRPT